MLYCIGFYYNTYQTLTVKKIKFFLFYNNKKDSNQQSQISEFQPLLLYVQYKNANCITSAYNFCFPYFVQCCTAAEGLKTMTNVKNDWSQLYLSTCTLLIKIIKIYVLMIIIGSNNFMYI